MKNYNLLREKIVEENLKIELIKYLNERRSLNEGILSDSYNFLKNISKKTLRVLWEATKFAFRNTKAFFKALYNSITSVKVIFFNTFSIVSLLSYSAYFDNNEVEERSKKIIEKIKESSETFTISFDDKEKIEKFCKLSEIKIFALETEDNYLCLPFDDEKEFKVLKMANYYDSYFDITDQESADILDLVKKYKDNPSIERIDDVKIGDINPIPIIFEDEAVQKKNPFSNAYGGYFNPNPNNLYIVVVKNENLNWIYEAIVHEFTHYKDFLIYKDKFTNRDFHTTIEKLSGSFEKNDIVSYEEIEKELNMDKSAVRYLVSLLQKKGYIEYNNNDFTKIKILSFPQYKNAATKNISNIFSNSEHEYFGTAIEENTHFTDVMNNITNSYEDYQKLSKNEDDNFSIWNISKIRKHKDTLKFDNDFFEKIKEYNENFDSKEKSKDVRELNNFLKKIYYNNDKIEIKKKLKVLNKFKNLDLIKKMNLDQNQLNDFITQLENKDLNITSGNLFSFFAHFDVNILPAYKIKNMSFEEFAKDILQKWVEEKVNQIYSEIEETRLKDASEEKKDTVYYELLQDYNKKVLEKLNHYLQNHIKNKDKFKNITNENLLKKYIRTLLS